VCSTNSTYSTATGCRFDGTCTVVARHQDHTHQSTLHRLPSLWALHTIGTASPRPGFGLLRFRSSVVTASWNETRIGCRRRLPIPFRSRSLLHRASPNAQASSPHTRIPKPLISSSFDCGNGSLHILCNSRGAWRLPILCNSRGAWRLPILCNSRGAWRLPIPVP
jgi:hypothetical protein